MNFKLNPFVIHTLFVNSMRSESERVADGFSIMFRSKDDEDNSDQYICDECCIENEDLGKGLSLLSTDVFEFRNLAIF